MLLFETRDVIDSMLANAKQKDVEMNPWQ